MRIRTIKPEFWSHPVMAAQSDVTKLLAIGLLNYADDEGYFYADPRMVRNALRPLDDDSVNTQCALTELANIGYIEMREHPTHGMIGWVVGFGRHQNINRKSASKLKPLLQGVKPLTEDSVSNQGALTDSSSLEQGTGNRERSTPKVPLEGTVGELGNADLLEKQALFRIRKFFGKRERTPLDKGEERAWGHRGNRDAVVLTGDGDWLALEWFYGLPESNPAARFRRRGMAQLLNNWNAEIVRARAAAAEAGVSFVAAGLGEDREGGPPGWRELLLEECPELALPVEFGEMDLNLRRWAWEIFERKKESEKRGIEQ